MGISFSSRIQHDPDSVYQVIHDCDKENLTGILRSGWDVNEIWYGNRVKTERTALYEAARQGWTEGMSLLLNAGAKCQINDGVGRVIYAGRKCVGKFGVCWVLENPLALAMHNHNCMDLVKLLLKHGADPNHHDHRLENIPLLCAMTVCRHNQNITMLVELLLKHGADPNVITHKGVSSQDLSLGDICPLFAALSETDCKTETYGERYIQVSVKEIDEESPESVTRRHEVSGVLLNTLLQYGADMNYNADGRWPLLHRLLEQYDSFTCTQSYRFCQRQLELFFKHGGNINMEDGECRTGIEYGIICDTHSNNIRWLIRHGADISFIEFTLLKFHFWSFSSHSSDTHLLLLQAGMRVPYGAQALLSNIEMVISTFLLAGTGDEGLDASIRAIWDPYEEAEQRELQNLQCNLRKSTFSDHLQQQMLDLEIFSDQSLHVYLEHTRTWNTKKEWQNIVEQIHTVLEFMSQPKPLQYYCRCCIRENLVSLQPSVVKMLHIPAKLKCYILCHEI